MKHVLILLLVVCPSFADTTMALIDASNNVVRIAKDIQNAPTGTTTVSGVSVPAGVTSVEDEYGRCAYKLVGSALVPQSPVWPQSVAAKAIQRAKLIRKVDELHQRIILVERWQTSYTAIRDRTNELTSLNSDRDALIAILEGP